MIEACLVPCALDVTVATFLAQCAFVLVILFVTRDTGRLQLVSVQVPGMAGVAPGLPMLATQGKFRGFIMVEAHGIPGLGVMTGLAFFAKTALVLVVFSVTRHAGHRRVLEDIVAMTIPALRIGMLAFKFEIRGVMVEPRFLPAGLGMAIRTLRTQPSLVRVVLLVARDTHALRTAKFLPWLVTLAAFRFRVLSLERVIRQRVVKTFLVQHDNPCLASLVFRMAGATGLFLDPPVVPLFLRHILAHVLVAVPAQSVLSFPVKSDMTVRTLLFRLGVPPDELARHQHVFQRTRLSLAKSQPRRHP